MKKLFRIAFYTVSALLCIVYLLSCFTPIINPVSFWPMVFISLGYPYLVIAFLALILAWIFVDKKATLYLLIVFLLGYSNLRSLFAIHVFANDIVAPKGNSLRILGWNARGFDNCSRKADSPNCVRRQMFAYLQKVDADVLCIEEFTEHKGRHLLSNTSALVDLGYKYYYKSNEIYRPDYYDTAALGTAIFSKLPLSDTGRYLLGDPSFPENLIHADVLYQGKPVRIFAAHLKSYNLFATPIDSGYRVRFHNDAALVYSGTKFQKLKAFSQDHARQSEMVKAQLDQSPIPFVFATDMNSVPAAYAYHTIAGNLTDAFLHRGFGVGTTYTTLSSTLRIDYMFVNDQFSIRCYHKDNIVLSDHYPHFIDIGWAR